MTQQPAIDRFKMIRSREEKNLTRQITIRAGLGFTQSHLSRLEYGVRTSVKVSTLDTGVEMVKE
ncbi:MAG: hypothetical protein ACYC3S_07155 [Chloroflexota bacterium]